MKAYTIPASSDSPYYSAIYYDTATGEPLITMSMPIKELGTIRLKGVLVCKIKLKFMWDQITNMKVGSNGIAYMTDHNGRFFAHPNQSVAQKNSIFKAPSKPTIMQGTVNRTAVVAAAKIQFGGNIFFLITEDPTNEAFKYINRSIIIISVQTIPVTLLDSFAASIFYTFTDLY